MMNKKKNNVLGKILIKDRNAKKYSYKNSFRHTSELDDGKDYNRINFNSITEQTDVDNFLTTAELAGTDFTAERLNVKFVNTRTAGILSEEEHLKLKRMHLHNKDFLRIPRRPPWDRTMTAEELGEDERMSFLEWRRTIGLLEAQDELVMTPYEKNLEFWRQLWRVIERSDVVVQIVDARNPLLFYCEDLSKYVLEVSPAKRNLLLVNKADFLTESQRIYWSDYFQHCGIEAIFFSAVAEDTLSDIDEGEEELREQDLHDLNMMNLNEDDDNFNSKEDSDLDSSDDEFYDCSEEFSTSPCVDQVVPMSESMSQALDDPNSLSYVNYPKTQILSKKELVEVFRSFTDLPNLKNYVTIGLVGYPNVGKSSTINRLMEEKRVSVSATPGKTKHFQTLFLTDDVLLCDCPGLVFPGFVSSKEEMIISGILPIDQIRDHVPSMNMVLSVIPRPVLESKYGVSIPPPPEGDDPDRSPTSEEFINVYGYMRGFMTPRGIPDHPRTARYVLKDFVNGKLLYCHAPPIVDQEEYHEMVVEKVRKTLQPTPQQMSIQGRQKSTASIDATFFEEETKMFHYNGKSAMNPKKLQKMAEKNGMEGIQKPWRLASKRNTRQKSRIKYAYLDQ